MAAAKTETPALTLSTGVLPQKKSGRKPKEINSELYDLLLPALSEVHLVDGRPQTFGPPFSFDTQGKATTDARRYVKALTEVDDAPLKGVDISVTTENPDEGVFYWKLYRKVKKEDSNSNSN